MASKPFQEFAGSSVGKKVVMALSGLFLVLFVIIHMLGNLSFLAGPETFNAYSHKLISLGPLLYVIEIILLLAFLFHAYYGIVVSAGNRRARPQKYAGLKSAGDPSKKSISSVTMIYTGIILLIFLIIHLKTFKFGPNVEDGYVMELHGEKIRDLHRLVLEKFSHPEYAFGYIAVMLLLGFHLRHGFWSAFQSLGANHPRYSPLIYTVGVILAVLLAVGFIAVPLLTYFKIVG
ncbi:MAG: succinate dehydrogenase [Calditrichaeota bacterium]|nr:MAG: succinate dehydrogenase [Calditrichota bacterium]